MIQESFAQNAYIHDTIRFGGSITQRTYQQQLIMICNSNTTIYMSCLTPVYTPQGTKRLTTNPSRDPLHTKASHELQPGTTHGEVTNQIPYQRDKLEYSGEQSEEAFL